MTKIQLRHDTAANWASENPILAEGEAGFETDTNKFKFGNGNDNYNSLPYVGTGGGGLEIGDIGTALYIDETKGKRRWLNGSILAINENTQGFVNWLKNAVQSVPSLTTSETNWQAEATLSAYGQCGKFVIDETAGTIRLPKVVNIQGLQDLTKTGIRVAAGLPNIQGDVLNFCCVNAKGLLSNKATGEAIKAGSEANIGGQTAYPSNLTTVDNANNDGFKFNASWDNPIYGNSDTVQPEAIQYPYFIQIATGSETEVDIVNEIELNNPFSLFDFKRSDHLLENVSWIRADDFSWYSGAVYVSAYADLLSEYSAEASTDETDGDISYKRTPKGYKIALSNQENAIDSVYSSKGVAWYYILDTENVRFKLPRTKYDFVGIRNGVGDFVNESLPNITGTLLLGNQAGSTWPLIVGGASGSLGPLYTNSTASVATTNNIQNTSSGVNLNASYSSNTYQDNAPVQQRSTETYLYFYVGETVQNANLIDAGRIGEQLPNKLDKSTFQENALQKSQQSEITGWGFPSGKFVDLTLGKNAASYTAPADGYVVVRLRCLGNNVTTFLQITQDGFQAWGNGDRTTNNLVGGVLPVHAGSFVVAFQNTTFDSASIFRFYYAQGNAPTT